MLFHDLSCDIQSYTESLLAVHIAPPVKTAEDAVFIINDPHAEIADFNLCEHFIFHCPDNDF